MRFSADFEDGVTTFVPNRKGIAEVAATQYKRVVLEGPVRNRQDGTFYIGAEDEFIDANLIDASQKHVKSVEDIPAPKPVEDFRPGDVVRTALGSILVYDPEPYNYDEPFRIVSETLGLGESVGSRFHIPTRPLTLLVRNGKVVGK